MNRFYISALAFLLAIVCGNNAVLAQSTFSGGSGTEADPYLISSATDLDELAASVNSGTGYSGQYFKMTADIAYDINVENNFTPIGTTANPFKGSFDGDSHAICGINFHRTTSCNGIFGYITGGSVSNLTLTASTLAGYDNTGGIVGYVSYKGVVNCHVGADVTITALGRNVGGIVGQMYGYAASEICGCTNAATVVGGSKSYIGGIIGLLSSGWVKDCFSTGNVTGTGTYVNGVIGGPTNETAEKCANSYFYNSNIALPNLGNSAITQRGKKAWKVTAATGVELDFGAVVTDYGRVKAFAAGLMVDSIFYAGGYSYSLNSYSRAYVFDLITVTPQATPEPGFAPLGYKAMRSGTTTSVPLSDNGDGSYSFYMPQTYGTGSDVLFDADQALVLLNDDSQDTYTNAQRLADHGGETLHVMLQGRTLQCDGFYNTLCLPFNLGESEFAASPLAGCATDGIKTLSPESSIQGSEVSLVFATAPRTVTAGQPFLIRWEAQDESIADLVFRNVTIVPQAEPQVVAGGHIRFTGYYQAMPITAADADIYYLTVSNGENVLRPTAIERTLKSCRAYFQFSAGNSASVKSLTLSIRLNVDDAPTFINKVEDSAATQVICDLQGRRVAASHMRNGIYIVDGRKVMVK